MSYNGPQSPWRGCNVSRRSHKRAPSACPLLLYLLSPLIPAYQNNLHTFLFVYCCLISTLFCPICSTENCLSFFGQYWIQNVLKDFKFTVVPFYNLLLLYCTAESFAMSGGRGRGRENNAFGSQPGWVSKPHNTLFPQNDSDSESYVAKLGS